MHFTAHHDTAAKWAQALIKINYAKICKISLNFRCCYYFNSSSDILPTPQRPLLFIGNYLLLCSHSHNDVLPPTPHLPPPPPRTSPERIHGAAVRGAVRPSRKLVSWQVLYMNRDQSDQMHAIMKSDDPKSGKFLYINTEIQLRN